MPVTLVQPLPVGNAIRLFISPPQGAIKWRLLRKSAAGFSGYDDPNASVIMDGVERVVLDSWFLTNGQPYYYGLFWFNGTVWAQDGSVTATPSATFAQIGTDVLSMVRDRLDFGLQVIVERGVLHHQNSHIQVLTAPPLFDESLWPVVTVHMQGDSSAEHVIGEQISPDYFDADAGKWQSFEGFLSRYSVLIVGWCLNPDERLALRKAIKDVLIANRPVFDSFGMVQIDITQSDVEDFQSYNAPVFQVMTTLSCLAPSLVNSIDNAIESVSVTQINP